MSSMRMLRMNIPMGFSLNFYKDEILKTINENRVSEKARIRVTVFRKDGGLYEPLNNDINFIIEIDSLAEVDYDIYEIELYKDFPVFSGLLSTIKTNNRIINVLSSIYSSENKYQNCILINEKKNIVETINANIFLIKGNEIFTPALSEGCINGIIRKKLIEVLSKNDDYFMKETAISPFELLKADEVFITNSIFEIQSVYKYRKKNYATVKTKLIKQLFENYKEEEFNLN
jgi:branched-chain amino acid aminotransferase